MQTRPTPPHPNSGQRLREKVEGRVGLDHNRVGIQLVGVVAGGLGVLVADEALGANAVGLQRLEYLCESLPGLCVGAGLVDDVLVARVGNGALDHHDLAERLRQLDALPSRAVRAPGSRSRVTSWRPYRHLLASILDTRPTVDIGGGADLGWSQTGVAGKR